MCGVNREERERAHGKKLRNLHGCHLPHFHHFIIKTSAEDLENVRSALKFSLHNAIRSMSHSSSDTGCVYYLLQAFQRFWFPESTEAVGNRTLHKISNRSPLKRKIWKMNKVKRVVRKWTRRMAIFSLTVPTKGKQAVEIRNDDSPWTSGRALSRTFQDFSPTQNQANGRTRDTHRRILNRVEDRIQYRIN